MIKVMQVLTDTNIGGAGIWLINFLKNYDKSKLDVFVVLPSDAVLTDRVEALGVRVVKADTIADCSFSVSSVSELKQIIKREKPDVIHTHASLSARIAARLSGVKTVHTRHCLEKPKTFPKSLIYSLINNSLSTHVIGVSKAVTDNLVSDGIKERKLSLVYNGITPLNTLNAEEKARAKERFGIPPDEAVVGLVARLEPVKNPLLFVRAAKLVLKRYPEVRFLLVGEGSLRGEVEKATEPIKDRISITGYISDVENAYNAMDILTLTSDSEALSISLIEGQSIGLPVISTDSGGPKEIIDDGINGTLTPVNDEKALADAIIGLIESPSERKRMGEAGKEKALIMFGADTMARKIEKIYKSITDKKRKD